MTPFEKKILEELKGIRKELHELNRKSVAGQVDGVSRDVNWEVGSLGQLLIKDEK